VTGGVSPTEASIDPGEPSICVMILPATETPKKYYTEGINIVTVPYERYLPRAKSLNYMAAVVTVQNAKEKDAQDVLYITKEGNILEGTTWNFFAVINGEVYTPEEDILFGITRSHLLSICEKSQIKVHRGELHMSQIKNFQEAFATSTTKEVMPVVKIDEQVISKTPGPVTIKLMQLFKDSLKGM